MKKKDRIKLLVSFLVLLSLSGTARAQGNDPKDNVNYDSLYNVTLVPVVISSNHTPVPKRQAPSLVGVVSSRTMEATQSVCVGDALGYQCGVRVEDNCASCGFKQARINGLDGYYSQILIDSRPVLSSVSNLFGLEQLPANMIQRTEVMRGGGSALYGASAVGGTINIITREPAENSTYLSHSLTSIGLTNSLDNVTSLNSSFVSDNGKSGATLFFQDRQRDGFSYWDDGYTTLPQLHVTSAGTRAFFKTGDFSRLVLSYYFMNDDRRGGNKLAQPVEQSNLAEESAHRLHNLNGIYHWNSEDNTWHADLFASLSSLQRKSYAGGYLYDDSPDPDAYKYHMLTRDFTVNGGGMARYHFQKLLFMPADLTLGVEYTGDFLRDSALGYHLTTQQDIHIGSVYFQNEWKSDDWDLLIGARADKHNLIDHVVLSPRVNVKYSPVTGLDLRAGYSDGFRAPQIFDQDLHVSMAGGERYGIVLADDLKEERSHTLNLSADYYLTLKKVRMNFTAEGFYTQLNDVFADRLLSATSASGAALIEKYNASGARYSGINLEWKTKYNDLVESDLGITLQRSRYDEAQQWSDAVAATDKILRTPDAYGYLTLCLTPNGHLDFDITGTYTGSMLVAHMAGSGTAVDEQVETDPFLDLNLKATYRFTLSGETQMEVALGLLNAFDSYQKDLDRGVERDSDYIYGPSLPRSFTCSVALKF